MIDQKLKLWLLEVNLSPACAERTDWLVTMLDKAASGMFSLIERKLAKVSDDFRGELKKYMSVKRKMKPVESQIDGWHLIYDQSKSKNYIA